MTFDLDLDLDLGLTIRFGQQLSSQGKVVIIDHIYKLAAAPTYSVLASCDLNPLMLLVMHAT